MSIKMEVWGTMRALQDLNSRRSDTVTMCRRPARHAVCWRALYWHPGLTWIVDKIYVMSPIRFTNLRRNELKSKILASAILSEANGKAASYIDRNADIQQRATMMLRDVHYVIEAHFEMTDKANAVG